jgi:hypothetical protein
MCIPAAELRGIQNNKIKLFFKIKPTCTNIIQILGRERESLAYTGTNTVYPATLVFGIVSEAKLTAFAASDTHSAPLNLPRQDLLIL